MKSFFYSYERDHTRNGSSSIVYHRNYSHIIFSIHRTAISSMININRTGKQCRERFKSHLAPKLKKGDWTPEEDKIIIDMKNKLGNYWARIALLLPGRSGNAYYYLLIIFLLWTTCLSLHNKIMTWKIAVVRWRKTWWRRDALRTLTSRRSIACTIRNMITFRSPER